MHLRLTSLNALCNVVLICISWEWAGAIGKEDQLHLYPMDPGRHVLKGYDANHFCLYVPTEGKCY